MKKLRLKNESADEREKKGSDAVKVMIECELCRDLFRPSHVQLPKEIGSKDRGKDQVSVSRDRITLKRTLLEKDGRLKLKF